MLVRKAQKAFRNSDIATIGRLQAYHPKTGPKLGIGIPAEGEQRRTGNLEFEDGHRQHCCIFRCSGWILTGEVPCGGVPQETTTPQVFQTISYAAQARRQQAVVRRISDSLSGYPDKKRT